MSSISVERDVVAPDLGGARTSGEQQTRTRAATPAAPVTHTSARAPRSWLTVAREDIAVVFEKDPAATSVWEVLLYPHLHAMWVHRLAHRLYVRGGRFWPRFLALLARFFSGGIDIHPGATIGRRFFIDHGSGVVIGETATIGDDVMLYHQVTLGATGWWRDMRRAPNAQRHPTIEDSVVIGSGASVLGPVTVGARSKIGAQALVIESIPPDSIVLGHAGTIIRRSADDTIVAIEQPVDDWVV